MQEFIRTNHEQIVSLCREHHVRRLAAFGSALREDFDPIRSDIDLLVEWEPMTHDIYLDNQFAFRQALSNLFGRRVDLITWKSIVNPYFLEEVESSHEMLYAA